MEEMTSKEGCHEKAVIDYKLNNYMLPIDSSINDNFTLQKVLKISNKASREFCQSKLVTLIWQNPTEYEDVFVNLSAFHTMLSYLGILGRWVQGSGIEEIIMSSGYVPVVHWKLL